jgi:hypothetical protein
MITVVKFFSASEFIAEVLEDARHVSDGLVRVTRETKRHSQLPLAYISVLATALVTPERLLPPFDKPVSTRLVSLKHYCAHSMGDAVEDPAFELSGKIMQKIEDAMRERGLFVRPGVIEVPNQQGGKS